MTMALGHRAAFTLGTMLLRRQRWGPAAWLLGRAVQRAPEHWESHNNLAIALLKLELWADAARAAERAASLAPAAAESHDLLGIALLRQERWEEAVAACRQAVAADPARYETHHRLGMGLQQLSRWEEAVTALRRAVALAQAAPGAAAQIAALERDLANAEARGAPQAAERTKAAAATQLARYEQRQAAFWTADNLGSDVFAVERWLQELSSAVPSQPGPGPKLLFVLDKDFGELVTVEFFVLGQELAGRSTLLLPERLYTLNANAIPGRTHQYRSVADILAAVDRERPDIVFLCSGYLLWEHLEFTHEDLGRLIAQLRERGCRVVTADPYLGMLSKQDPRTLISIDIPATHPRFTLEQLTRAKRAADERAWIAFAHSERILRDTYHLYPSFCDVAADDVARSDGRNVAFFNDRLLRPAPSASKDGIPHWLFILAFSDYDTQTMFEGGAFPAIVANKLLETRAAGRHPVLIAPKAFVDELLPRMPTLEGIDILSHCPFTQFMALLLSAEHAFYWNVLSHSLLGRLYNQLPIVLFDRGHLVRSAPAIYDRIVGWYYQGWQPTLRSHHQPLTLETVEGWAAEYRLEAARLVERFRRAPSPEEMIADLMSRPVNVA